MSSDDDDDADDSVFSEEHEEQEADVEADDESSDGDDNDDNAHGTSENPRSAVHLHKVTNMNFNDARLYTPDESETSGSTSKSFEGSYNIRNAENRTSVSSAKNNGDKVPLYSNWKHFHSNLTPHGDGAVSDSELYVRCKTVDDGSVLRNCASDPNMCYTNSEASGYCCCCGSFPCGVPGLFTRNVTVKVTVYQFVIVSMVMRYGTHSAHYH